jgi:aspartate racemase
LRFFTDQFTNSKLEDMQTAGLIGGMSWQSSAIYYRLINEEVKRRAGGFNNAPSVMVTVNFSDIEKLQRSGDWETQGLMLAEAAKKLEIAGADFLVLCTNTMHKVAGAIEGAVNLPLLHIVDVTAQVVLTSGFKRVGLLATKFTMEESFYSDRMRERFGIETIIPDADSRQLVHDIIYDELCMGVVKEESRRRYQRVIQDLQSAGAKAVILGCTEIGLLISPEDSVLPVFDSTVLHAMAAVDLILADRDATGH